MTVTEFGGFAPEPWRGSVDGHTFYFRERHDQWRIELDLRPTGRFHKVFKGGDFDDDSSFELAESLEGDVIAEGTTGPFNGARRAACTSERVERQNELRRPSAFLALTRILRSDALAGGTVGDPRRGARAAESDSLLMS